MSNCVKSAASCVRFFASPLSLDALNPRGNLHCQGRATPEKHLRTPPPGFLSPSQPVPFGYGTGWLGAAGGKSAGWLDPGASFRNPWTAPPPLQAPSR